MLDNARQAQLAATVMVSCNVFKQVAYHGAGLRYCMSRVTETPESMGGAQNVSVARRDMEADDTLG